MFYVFEYSWCSLQINDAISNVSEDAFQLMQIPFLSHNVTFSSYVKSKGDVVKSV